MPQESPRVALSDADIVAYFPAPDFNRMREAASNSELCYTREDIIATVRSILAAQEAKHRPAPAPEARAESAESPEPFCLACGRKGVTTNACRSEPCANAADLLAASQASVTPSQAAEPRRCKHGTRHPHECRECVAEAAAMPDDWFSASIQREGASEQLCASEPSSPQEPGEDAYTLDAIGLACARVEIPDSLFERLSIELRDAAMSGGNA